MQVLVIERFLQDFDDKSIEKYMKENEKQIMQLHQSGEVTAFWKRGDKPGTVLMLNTESLDTAKKMLASFPLVKSKILTYNFLPLEPYQVSEILPEEYLTMVYVSEAVNPFDDNMIVTLLEQARNQNEKVAISGVLLYEKGSFLQLIEGKPAVINNLYKKILKDPRHKNVAKLIEFKSSEKIFSEWSMGHAQVTTEQLESLEGMNDFFSNYDSFSHLNNNQVQNILNAFREGKWRQKITG